MALWQQPTPEIPIRRTGAVDLMQSRPCVVDLGRRRQRPADRTFRVWPSIEDCRSYTPRATVQARTVAGVFRP